MIKEKEPKFCKRCNKKFTPIKITQRCCNPDCQKKENNKLLRLKRLQKIRDKGSK